MFYIILLLFTYLSIVGSMKIAIVGSGPSGLLFASKVLTNNSPVDQIDIFESRDDPRVCENSRSFAIGVNNRSFTYLAQCHEDLPNYLKMNSFSAITKTTTINGLKKLVNSDPRFKITRYMTTQPLITVGLLNWLDRLSSSSKCKLTTYFNSKIISVDSFKGELFISNNDKLDRKQYDLIIGADGARSTIRQAILQQPNISYESYPVNNRWKFIPLSVADTENSSAFFNVDDTIGGWWSMPTKKVHLVLFWRTQNPDEFKNPSSMKTISHTKELIKKLFDVEPNNLDEVAEELFNSNTYVEYVFKVNKYFHNAGKVVIIGDAAHTMSSALGQGMTVGFADALALYDNLSKYEWKDISKAIESYSNERVPEGNAIVDLNFERLSGKFWTMFYGFIDIFGKKFIPNYKIMFDYLASPTFKYVDILKRYKSRVEKGFRNSRKDRR